MTNRGRILVVDDDVDVAFALSGTVERLGWEARAVHSASNALALLAREEFDVVVTDLVMGATSGLDLCASVAEMQPHVPVIVVTAFASLDTAIDAIRKGAFDYVQKPATPEALGAAVERALRGRKPGDRAESAPAGHELIGSSEAMRKVRDLIARVAQSDASVVVQGETGTGKEVVARALHEASGRIGSFVAVNCACIPETLVESELFGHVRGAFTDARTRRRGLFAQAHRGTMFLDEIGELPLSMQPKLLRALQERRVRPVGAGVEVPFDARLVSASNRDLEDLVAERRFREDLLYRLDTVRIRLPPLRERVRDVIDLALHFLARAADRGRPPRGLAPDAIDALLGYAWPGNVRELEHCMDRALVLARDREIRASDLPDRVRARSTPAVPARPQPNAEVATMAQMERRHIAEVLESVGGNKVRAARALGMHRKTLYRKLAKLGLAGTRPVYRGAPR